MMISDLDLPYKAPHLKNDFLAMTKKTYLGWYLTTRLYTSVLRSISYILSIMAILSFVATFRL